MHSDECHSTLNVQLVLRKQASSETQVQLHMWLQHQTAKQQRGPATCSVRSGAGKRECTGKAISSLLLACCKLTRAFMKISPAGASFVYLEAHKVHGDREHAGGEGRGGGGGKCIPIPWLSDPSASESVPGAGHASPCHPWPSEFPSRDLLASAVQSWPPCLAAGTAEHDRKEVRGHHKTEKLVICRYHCRARVWSRKRSQ